MSASLVGSEMCIRDRPFLPSSRKRAGACTPQVGSTAKRRATLGSAQCADGSPETSANSPVAPDARGGKRQASTLSG
eukprot:13728352-Alexandrium_andersonii.AAC.1